MISFKSIIDSASVGGTTALVRSKTIVLPSGDPSFALEYKFSKTTGTVGVKLEIEQSNDGTNFAIPDDLPSPLVAECNDVLYHIISFSPRPTKFARILMTPNLTNSANTVITALNLSTSANIVIKGE